MRFVRNSILIVICLFLVSGCGVANGFLPGNPPVPTLTPVNIVPSSGGNANCAYSWADQDVPELTQKAAQAFQAAGMSDVQVRASAYGENCVDPNTNKVTGFSPMQTDFYLDIPVQAVDDQQALGDWISKALPVLNQLPGNLLKGPNMGYVGISFKNGDQIESLWFPRAKANSLIDQGTKGSALYQALQNP